MTKERLKIKRHIRSFILMWRLSIILEAEQKEQFAAACTIAARDHAQIAAALIHKLYGKKIGPKLALKMVLLHPDIVIDIL